MNRTEPIELPQVIFVNGNRVSHVVIGRHYREKHSSYMTDDFILLLAQALDGHQFAPDSTTRGIEYFVADVEMFSESKNKLYRIVWLFEGNLLEILGVVNAYRVKKRRG